ncbi:MAG: DinB family protein [Longimicrobiaceae bacterium]
MSRPEAWLRGPLEGVPTQLQAVAHALVQALEDVERAAAPLAPEELRARPGGAASVGFHLRHLAGSTDRLLAYAHGEQLAPAQLAFLAEEEEEAPGVGAAELLAGVRAAVERALEQLRATPEAALDEPREVGRGRLPSSVRGLLYHVGEHTARHAGQVVTTARVVRGAGGAGGPA